MSYTVTINASNQNPPFQGQTRLTRDQLEGAATALVGFFGPEEVYQLVQLKNNRGQLQDLNQILRDTIISSGEEAFDFQAGPEGWLASLEDANINPSKSYTARIDFPNEWFVVQFDDPSFINGFADALEWIGQNYEQYLPQGYYYHDQQQMA